MYLVTAVLKSEPKVEVRLFEGFVSFKRSGRKRSHCEDVVLLKEVVTNPERYSNSIVAGNCLKVDPTDIVKSAFLVAGVDLGIPPVIVGDGQPLGH